MKITLVMPGVGRKPGEAYVNSWKMEPLALAVLAALTPADVEVRFVDDRLEPIPYDEADRCGGHQCRDLHGPPGLRDRRAGFASGACP